MAETGTAQILKLAVDKETTFGAKTTSYADPGNFTAIGLVEDGEVGGKTSISKIFGIGTSGYQASFPGGVENSLRCALVCPSAAQMMRAVTRDTDTGELDSFNFLAGQQTGAWQGVGLKWDSLDIEIDATNPLKASLSGLFQSVVEIDKPTTGTEDHGVDFGEVTILRSQGMQLTLDQGSGAVQDVDVSSVKIGVKNNLSAQFVAGAGSTLYKRVAKYIKEGNLDIDATIQTMTAQDPTSLQDDLMGCGDGIELVMTFVDLCDTDSTPATALTITCTGGTFTEMRQPIKANDYIEYSVGITFSTINIA